MSFQKNSVILSLNPDTSEISQLAESLGYKVVKTFFQKRLKPDVNTYMGPGKLKEIKEYIEENKEINLVIIDGELKPSQWFTVEKTLNIDVYDRIRLILALFETRAERKEAKLQVKLAQLHYERPYVRELIHRARSGEHPGFMAGGEYQVDDYYEMIKKQMKKIRVDLEKIRTDRNLQRQTRYKSGFYLISLAGYTNAGKSSLLNLLSKENVKVEGKLFSTLSTTTRKINHKPPTETFPILLTDTVGFIRNLPAWVIDAFHSTLEEIELADVVLLVVDGSEAIKIVKDKLKTSFNELQTIGVTSPIIVVFNKTDLLDKHKIEDKIQKIKESDIPKDLVFRTISVEKKKNISLLIKTIYQSLPHLVNIKMKLPSSKHSQAFISQLYDKTRIIDIEYDKRITIKLECNSKIKEKLIAQCIQINGTILK